MKKYLKNTPYIKTSKPIKEENSLHGEE